MARRTERMKLLLEAALHPTTLEIIDDSASHAGHAGAAPGGETHYTVKVSSPRFEGLSRVAQHRLVNEALAEEFKTGLHALAVEVKPSS